MNLSGLLREALDAQQAAHVLRELSRTATNLSSRMGMAEKPIPAHHFYDENFTESCRVIQEYLIAIAEWAESGRQIGRRLQRLIEDHYTDPGFGLSEAADIMGMSHPYLSRVFKRETGEGFQDMLTRVRIERAAKMLLETDCKVRDIAFRVGFDNERYFGQVFRKHMQVTPIQYRNANTAK